MVEECTLGSVFGRGWGVSSVSYNEEDYVVCVVYFVFFVTLD